MDYYNYANAGNNFNNQAPNMQQQQVQAYIPNGNIMFMYSHGKEAAMAYPMAPDKIGYFLDDQNPYMYRRTTDRYGRTIEFKNFRIEEEPDEISMSEGNFVTKQAFDESMASINNTLSELKNMLSVNNNQRHNNQYKGKKVNNNG